MEATVTTPAVSPLLGVFKLNAQLMWKSIEDVSAEHIGARSSADVNSMHWLLGHLTSSRYFLANQIGIEDQNPFGETFGRGDNYSDSSGFPVVDEIKSKFDEITAKINPRLCEMTKDDLLASIEAQYPSQEKNVLGALGFWQFHESVHVGQLMLLRRVFGYSGLVG